MSAWLGHERIHLPRCDSTNDEAAERARRGAAHGTIVTADEQTAGRGRRGRTWHSPAGRNLYLSCVLRPPIEAAAVPPIALAAGVAVAETVNQRGVAASVKWPNDVLASGKKLAGILAEMSTRDMGLDYVILGIGVNLGSRSFPDDIAHRATSVALEGGDGEREGFLTSLLAALEARLDDYFVRGMEAIHRPWTERMYVGLVQVGDIQGMPRGIDEDGALILEDASGARHRIVAGDVDLIGWIDS